MYFGLVLVAPTFCHYIAYWCLLVKTHRLETKKHQLSFFMVLWAAQCVSCSKQEKHHNAWQNKNKKKLSCRLCVLVDLSRYKLTLCILWVGCVCTYFWHYIAWWCLFMKHVWRHLVAKLKLKGICSHSWFLQIVSAVQCVSCSKQEQFTTMPWAIPICSRFLALYCLMVFISKRLETKKAWVVILADCVCRPMC